MIRLLLNVLIKFKGLRYFLVFVQFFVLFWITITYDIKAANSLHFISPLLFLTLGIWSVLSMRLLTITPLPDPTKNSQLTQKGPYRFIRHPMYLSVLGYTISLLVVNFSLFNVFFVLFFCIALFLKMEIEEIFLTQRYPNYIKYLKHTKRLIPWIY